MKTRLKELFTFFLFVIGLTELRAQTDNILTDTRDRNIYKTVQIGNQTWMAENLKFLPRIDSLAVEKETTPYYYVYDYFGNNVSDAKSKKEYKNYGVLYNWTAAMNNSASSNSNPSRIQGVCPIDWHLPSDAEWIQLTDYLGGEKEAGRKLKEVGTTHWQVLRGGIQPDATDETGFTALPGGNCFSNGNFYLSRFNGYWWSSTESDSNYALYRVMQNIDSGVQRISINKALGFSVRCVKD